jgi:hypothetical protein
MQEKPSSRLPEWVVALKSMGHSDYWTKPNLVEFIAFIVKAVIIIPGLLFEVQVWWLYIAALVSSTALVWSSTAKTLPTLIWFNILWILLALVAIARHFVIE